MKAVVHHGPKGCKGLTITSMEDREPGTGEVKVRVKTAGLNHRDIWVLLRRNELDSPVILGSDGAGVVEAIGPDVENVSIGEEVIINPSLRWESKTDAPPAEFDILGSPTHGTFAEYVILPVENIAPKPAYLSWEEAGVLALAGLTAYRALFTKGNLKPDQKVLIPGIGSGVATLLLLMAKAAGATVYVTSRSEEKRALALSLGADAAIDSASDWTEALGGAKMDLVIESVGPATWDKSLAQLRTGGTIVTFGATTGDEINVNLRAFFYGQFKLFGTTMGSSEEFRELLQFIEKHQIRPVLDKTYSLSEAKEAFDRMEKGEQFGKIVFRIE